MKLQQRFASIGSTLVVIMVFATLGIAEAGCSHFGPFGGGFHRWHDGDMPSFVMKRLDAKVEKLNLTPVQKAKYDELRAHVKEQLLAAKEDRKQFREIVRSELAKESPDIAALNAMMKKKIERASQNLQGDLDMFVSFYSTLDEGQKRKVAAGIQRRMAARDTCREERQ